MSKDNKVVITGINIISSLGLNIAENWENMIQGKSGVKRITLFDPSGLETQIAAQVPDAFEEYASTKVKKRRSSQMASVSHTKHILVTRVIWLDLLFFTFVAAYSSKASGIWAAICVSSPDGSNKVIRLTPLFPAAILSQFSCNPKPREEMIFIPVITTLLSLDICFFIENCYSKEKNYLGV